MDFEEREGRQTKRGGVAMTARLRVIGGKSFDAIASNLSATGCSVACPNMNLRPQQRVAIKLESLDFLLGVVQWAEESSAGIEFDRPLYAPVVEHLLRRFTR